MCVNGFSSLVECPYLYSWSDTTRKQKQTFLFLTKIQDRFLCFIRDTQLGLHLGACMIFNGYLSLYFTTYLFSIHTLSCYTTSLMHRLVSIASYMSLKQEFLSFCSFEIPSSSCTSELVHCSIHVNYSTLLLSISLLNSYFIAPLCLVDMSPCYCCFPCMPWPLYLYFLTPPLYANITSSISPYSIS